MGISTKKILTIILSISLLVVISCGDRPTGSTTDGGGVSSILPSKYNGNYASSETSGDAEFWWLIIKDGIIYKAIGTDKDNPPSGFETDQDTEKLGPDFKSLETGSSSYTADSDSGMQYKFTFNEDTTVKMDMLQDGQVGMSVSFTKK